MFLKIGAGDISSVHIKSIDAFSVDCEMEGEEYKVILKAELAVISELEAHSEAVCVADSFHNSSAPAQGLCSSVAASKSKSSQIFLFEGCRPVAIKPLVTIFLVCTCRYTLPKSSDIS